MIDNLNMQKKKSFDLLINNLDFSKLDKTFLTKTDKKNNRIKKLYMEFGV